MSEYFPLARLVDKRVRFADPDGFARACRHGAFHLEYEQGRDFSAGVRFARSFHRDPPKGAEDPYCGFRGASIESSNLGYSTLGRDQVELFQLEADLWKRYLPEALAELLWHMMDVARIVTEDTMSRLDISPEDMDTITGGMSANRALQYCLFNHYRSAVRQDKGFTAHKDSGFITVLYTVEPGMESWEEDRWIPLDPIAGHLTVVFGHSLEILTENLDMPIHASYHHVRPTPRARPEELDRISFGTYVGPRWDQDLYQYAENGTLQPHMSFLEFQKAKAASMNYEFHPRVEQAFAAKSASS